MMLNKDFRCQVMIAKLTTVQILLSRADWKPSFFPTVWAWQKSEVASHETQGIDSQILLADDRSLTGRR